MYVSLWRLFYFLFSFYRYFSYCNLIWVNCTEIAGMQSQLVCSGCRNMLLYPRGAPSVRCAVCQTITPGPFSLPLCQSYYLKLHSYVHLYPLHLIVYFICLNFVTYVVILDLRYNNSTSYLENTMLRYIISLQMLFYN